jgi:hypothetical protein
MHARATKLTHCLLNPHGLTPRPLCHLVDVGEEPLAVLGLVLGREHIALRRHPQQPFDCNLTSRQRAILLPEPLLDGILLNPPTTAQDLVLVPLLICPLQRRNNCVPILAIQHPRPNQHLLIMPQHSRRIHTPVLETLDGIRVNPQRQLQGRERQPVLEARNQLRLPPEPLHLPAAEYEGRDGDDGEDDEARPVLLTHARHLDRRVEDRDEVWVEAGLAAGAPGEDALRGGRRAGALCAEGRGARKRRGAGRGRVAAPEEGGEGVRFRHCRGCACACACGLGIGMPWSVGRGIASAVRASPPLSAAAAAAM